MEALAQARSTFRRLSAEQTTGIDWRKADGTKDHPVWASVPIETEPSKYDLVVLLAINSIRVHKSIILSGTAGTEYGRLPWLALSVMSGHTSNAASEGCHSIAQLIMSYVCVSRAELSELRTSAIYQQIRRFEVFAACRCSFIAWRTVMPFAVSTRSRTELNLEILVVAAAAMMAVSS